MITVTLNVHGIILAAGRGSRLGEITRNKPKLLLSIDGKTVYEHQINKMQKHCESVTIVIGHGFDSEKDPQVQKIFKPNRYDVRIDFEYLEDWDKKENSASLLHGIESLDHSDHLLIACGDVLFTEDLLDSFLHRFRARCLKNSENAVAYIPGVQNEMTAITLDSQGTVRDYGAIKGHQEAGLFVLHKHNINKAKKMLKSNKNDWFPIIFPETQSRGLRVKGEDCMEINTPRHYKEAKDWAQSRQNKKAANR